MPISQSFVHIATSNSYRKTSVCHF